MTKEWAVKESFAGGEDSRRAPLAMDAVTFRKLGCRLVDQVAGFLESMPSGPVTRDESPSILRDALDLKGALPEIGTDPGPLLEETSPMNAIFSKLKRYTIGTRDHGKLHLMKPRPSRFATNHF